MAYQKRLILFSFFLLGGVLRFTNLAEKSLWLDEIITGLFTLGQGYQVIPRETVFSIQEIPNFFTYQSQNCSVIAEALAKQSTHPPLFFCLMHQWLGITQSFNIFDSSLAIQLRSLPAIFGILSILLLYHLNRTAFSENAGLVAAGLMAVSPFAVYLSQEARQYTLLFILIAIALFALIQLIKPAHNSILYWLIWGIANSLGCYTHYFFFLAFTAQIIILFFFFLWESPRRLIFLLSVTIGIVLSYLPWLPTVITHFSSAKTNWLPSVDLFSPIYQLLLGFLVMMSAFPVEKQSIFIQILSGIGMLSFGGWILYQVRVRYGYLLQSNATSKATLALSLYLSLLLLQFLFIIYGLEKNIAIAPRYNYVYYPAVCALLGAILTAKTQSFQELATNQTKQFQLIQLNQPTWLTGLVGIISSLFVVSNLFFLKPYLPEVTAQRFNQFSEPNLIVMGYQDEMDLALGLSYGLALHHIRNETLTSKFIFLNRNQGYDQIWNQISQLPLKVSNVWVIGTGLKQVAFPETLHLNQTRKCQRDRANYYRIGIPYQRYSCDE
ncbi:MAG: hypothetical protein BRC33_09445 [Cyanobacteria bacterium SW_9_44_58]|nr:MAG: hypothetical protein BRC33_09445 [Cyanobacteria bacterium SW_9_44_58]